MVQQSSIVAIYKQIRAHELA